jgi:hypothetical protein
MKVLLRSVTWLAPAWRPPIPHAVSRTEFLAGSVRGSQADLSLVAISEREESDGATDYPLSDTAPDKESRHWVKFAGAVLAVLNLPVAGALSALKQARGWHFG